MAHEHHQWLADRNAEIQRDYERERELIADPSNIQQVGHRDEDVWKSILEAWLPPGYEVAKRKYIITEDETGSVTGETDLVVFSPWYPTQLREKTSVLAGGIVAAFSVKRTVTRSGIEEACQAAQQLRENMKQRGMTLRQELVPPVFYGLLGHSHRWQGSISEVSELVADIVWEYDDQNVTSPKDALDLICIADLNCWTRMTMAVSTNIALAIPARYPTGKPVVESGMMFGTDGFSEDDPAPRKPALAIFIAYLWQKLSHNDPALTPIADGFRLTDTSGSGKGTPRHWPLRDVLSEETRNAFENGQGIGPDWRAFYS